MRAVSISISKGNGNIKHNTRTQVVAPKNVDTLRSSQNIQLIHEPIEQVYSELFDTSVNEYNQSQITKGHAERQIKNYYKKIVHDKKTKPFHELVVQIGNREQQLLPKQTNAIYSEFVEQFKQANPQLKVIGAYIHNDEATPHMHLDYVPVATYKRGLAKRVSNDKAISQMGYKSWNDWRDKQDQLLESIVRNHGLDRQIMNNSNRHIADVEQFKRVQTEVEKQANQIIQEKREIKLPTPSKSINPITKKETFKLNPDDYQQIQEIIERQQMEKTSLEARKSVLEAQNELHELNIEKLKNKPYIAENERLKAMLEEKDIQINQKNKSIHQLTQENDRLKTKVNDLIDRHNKVISKHNELVEENDELKKSCIELQYKKNMAEVLSSYLIGFLDYLMNRILSHFMDIEPIKEKFEVFYKAHIVNVPEIKNSYEISIEFNQSNKECGMYNSFPNIEYYQNDKPYILSEKIGPDWSKHDLAIAYFHLNNYGIIFCDKETGLPIDDEYELETIVRAEIPDYFEEDIEELDQGFER